MLWDCNQHVWEREETRCRLCVSVNEGRFTSLAAKSYLNPKPKRISGAWLCANQHVHNKAMGSQSFRSWNSYHCCTSPTPRRASPPVARICTTNPLASIRSLFCTCGYGAFSHRFPYLYPQSGNELDWFHVVLKKEVVKNSNILNTLDYFRWMSEIRGEIRSLIARLITFVESLGRQQAGLFCWKIGWLHPQIQCRLRRWVEPLLQVFQHSIHVSFIIIICYLDTEMDGFVLRKRIL